MTRVAAFDSRMQLLRTKYASLAPGDRRALLILVGMVCVLLLFGIFDASSNYKSTAYQRLQDDLALQAWMQSNAAQVQANGHKPSAVMSPDQSLLSFSTSTAKEHGLEFKRFQPEGDDGLSLWLEHASFSALLTWLQQIEVDAGVQVQQLTIDRLPESDRVDVRVVLQR